MMALDLEVDIGLSNVPQDIEDPKVYAALLDIHNALEILTTQGYPTDIAELKTLLSLPYALVSNSVAQSIPNNVVTKKTFNTVDYDADGLWNAANNRFIVPAAALIQVSGNNAWANNSVGSRYATMKIDGATKAGLPQARIAASILSEQNISGELVCAANQYIEFEIYQTSGGALNTYGGADREWFSIRVLKWL